MENNNNCNISQQLTSFSFEYGHQLNNHLPVSQNMQPSRTLSQCLRLKTNESIQSAQQNPIDHAKKKTNKINQSWIDSEHQKKLAQEENQLRIESLVKQYQLRLNKQEEYYELREWKLKEQIENLQKQNQMLSEEIRRARTTPKLPSQRCTLCHDGQVLTHYNNLLKQHDKHHQNCLSQKKQLTLSIQQLQTKSSLLSQQNQTLCQDIRTLNKQLRQYQNKNKQLQKEYASWDQEKKNIEKQYQQIINQLQFQNKEMQIAVNNRNYQMQQSKTTVQSTQSIISNNYGQPNNSLKESLLSVKMSQPHHPYYKTKPEPKPQNKQNYYLNRNRKSFPKTIPLCLQHENTFHKDDNKNNKRNILSNISITDNINHDNNKEMNKYDNFDRNQNYGRNQNRNQSIGKGKQYGNRNSNSQHKYQYQNQPLRWKYF